MIDIELQRLCHVDNEPSLDQFKLWVEAVLGDQSNDIELVIRVVDEPESAALNEQLYLVFQWNYRLVLKHRY